MHDPLRIHYALHNEVTYKLVSHVVKFKDTNYSRMQSRRCSLRSLYRICK
jgi:hypothetical protein